ncbi:MULTISPECIES: GTP-binding protein [unclassified Modicisalibacter]|uniref:CobW family GTP-binding protein n=1 Tax=unclassified Modicisalibacter TaxID=2679913 RepID=UPI001CCA67F3|nr:MULTISPECIES: GTP-binding protein [unclassified Modicisalibacter]MBZ9558010.1 GTP-binding protein [Modicisalibacter sp. R2A 31.J]MBZ9573322.1 GTP-binding protein [Modicisalibacter sp. MOD 31.J]
MTDTTALLPVHVISGFLGSGKTTLLKSVLASEAFGDSAVLINEFGDVGLDDRLLGEIAEDAVLLASGCVCCTIRGELSDALRRLLSRRQNGEIPAFRRIVLETTGLADPGPIASTITADPVLRHHLRPGTNLTLVDAVNAIDSRRHHPVWEAQVAVADKLVISKTDLVDTSRIDHLHDLLDTTNPAAQRLGREALDQPSDALFASGPHLERFTRARVRTWLGPWRESASPETRSHLGDVSAFRLAFDGELDWTCFGLWLSMLLNRHGNDIMRVKGVLHVRDDPRPVILHGVQHTIHPPEHVEAWPDDDRRSELVFITRGIPASRVADSLQAFMSAVSDHPCPRISHA